MMLQPSAEARFRGFGRSTDLLCRWEQIACPLCGCDDTPILTEQADLKHPQRPRFAISECSSCRFRFTNPRPDPGTIGRFYQNDASTLGVWRRWLGWFQLRLDLRAEISWLRSLTLLAPWFIFQPAALHAAELPQELIGKLQVMRLGQDLNRIEFTKQRDSYSIYLRNILEHAHDPRAILEACFHSMYPGEPLALRVASWQDHHRAKHDLPRRLSHFTLDSLKQLCQVTGLAWIDHSCFVGGGQIFVLVQKPEW